MASPAHQFTSAAASHSLYSPVYKAYQIPPYSDSLIAKLIAYGRTREECLMRLRRAIDEFVVDGNQDDRCRSSSA